MKTKNFETTKRIITKKLIAELEKFRNELDWNFEIGIGDLEHIYGQIMFYEFYNDPTDERTLEFEKRKQEIYNQIVRMYEAIEVKVIFC